MPTLPMFDHPADPDAWHHVTAPGGYEWWYFDAEDVTGQFQLVAILLEGFVFHPGYLRRYARYLRRPTRTPPPVAGEYPCAYFVLYEDGKVAGQFMTQVGPSDFSAAADRPDVRVGPNRFRRADDGTLRLSLAGTPWRLTWQGPKLLGGQELSAELTFRPRTPPGAMERTFLSRRLAGAEHRWVIADPLCDVTGTIVLGEKGAGDGGIVSGGGAGGRRIEFAGRGYHDHNYGTAPIGPGLKRWVWGRAIAGGGEPVAGSPAAPPRDAAGAAADAAAGAAASSAAEDLMYTFHFARPRDARLPDEIHLIRADAAGRQEVAVAAATVDWSRRTPLGLAYPATIDFPPHLRLTAPRVVDSAPFYMRLVYDAALDGGSRRTTAFCEVAYPHRLRWPVLGRMIELSIHRPG